MIMPIKIRNVFRLFIEVFCEYKNIRSTRDIF